MENVVTLPVVRIERIPEPYGWVALYCGEKLFLDSEETAKFYAKLCEVVPVFTLPPQVREEVKP